MGTCSSCDRIANCIKCPICKNNICDECHIIAKLEYGMFKLKGKLYIKSCDMCTENDIELYFKKNDIRQCQYCHEYVNVRDITSFFRGICITCLTIWQINHDVV